MIWFSSCERSNLLFSFCISYKTKLAQQLLGVSLLFITTIGYDVHL